MVAKQNKKGGFGTQEIEMVFRVIRKNFLILILFPLLASGLGYFYAYKLPKIYGATTQILVKSGETYDYQQQIRKSLGYYGRFEEITNQKRVLQSRDLVEKALKKMEVDVSYFIVGRVKTTEVYKSTPFQVNMKVTHGQLYEKKIFLNILDAEKYRISYEIGDETYEYTYPFNKEVVSDHFIINVKTKNSLNPHTVGSLSEIDYYFKKHRTGVLVSRYMSSLNVETLQYTSILKVSVHDAIPQRGVAFLDSLSKVYIDHTLKVRKQVNENTITYIDRQLDEVVKVLNTIEDTLEEYKSQKAILDLEKEEAEYFNRLVSFDQKRRELKLRLQSLRNLEDYVVNLNTEEEELLPSSFYMQQNDEFLKKTVEELYNLQLDRNSKLYGATKASPKIKKIEKEIQAIKKNLLQYILNSKNALKNRLEDVKAEIAQYEGIIKNIPEKKRELLNIERRRKVNEKLYLFLLEKRASTVIARAGIVPETKVIETARSIGKVKPDKNKYVLSSAAGGFILSLLLVFLRFFFFQKVSSLRELSEITDLPVIGQIFRSKRAEKEDILYLSQDSKSSVVESLRTVRTNLQYFTGKKDVGNVIMINSVGPGEGKTFVSVNLASILAKANKKVLLLELDLHKPRIHKGLSISTETGISAYLSGKGGYKGLIQQTEIDHLDVALCGAVPPNASELILGEELEQLIAQAKQEYEYVIVDTPPIGVISDAMVIMQHTDVNLFVFNAKTTRKQEVTFVEELVEKNKIQNVGVILNAVKLNTLKGYYGRYAYLYGYGYGQYGYRD